MKMLKWLKVPEYLTDHTFIWGKQKRNWREPKLMESYYRRTGAENKYGQDDDYENFMGSRHRCHIKLNVNSITVKQMNKFIWEVSKFRRKKGHFLSLTHMKWMWWRRQNFKSLGNTKLVGRFELWGEGVVTILLLSKRNAQQVGPITSSITIVQHMDSNGQLQRISEQRTKFALQHKYLNRIYWIWNKCYDIVVLCTGQTGRAVLTHILEVYS
jgi:hypothetical protein